MRADKRVLPGDVAMWIFIIAELLTFAAFFLLFAWLERGDAATFASGRQQLHPFLGLLNTLILLTGGSLALAGVRAVENAPSGPGAGPLRGRQRLCRPGFFAAFLRGMPLRMAGSLQARPSAGRRVHGWIKADSRQGRSSDISIRMGRRFFMLAAATGVPFTVIKLWEFGVLAGQGLTLSSSTFHFFYFFLCFIHLAHVWLGMAILVLACRRLATSPLSGDGVSSWQAAASYWHMVDLAWLVLFPLLYLGGTRP
jgi:heme/copper-type cytochrome/quinol oxidase subunit 3